MRINMHVDGGSYESQTALVGCADAMNCGALRLECITKSFGAVVALRAVDLELNAGEIHAILGENGAGKSTLLKLMAGAEIASDGHMQLNGLDYAPRSPREARAAGVCVVHQEPSIITHQSVASNISLGCERTRFGFVNQRAQIRIATTALDSIGALGLVNPLALASTLTSGTRQLVEIARAFVAQPKVLLLDEPTSSLGRVEADHLWTAVGRLASMGVAIALVSHRLDEVRHIATRVTILRDGAIVDRGLLADRDDEALVRSMSGGSERRRIVRTRSPKALGSFALDSIELQAGEILGIGGLVGSGRSRWMRKIALQTGAPRVSEDRRGEGLAQSLSIAENLTLPIVRRLSRWAMIDRDEQARLTSQWQTALSIKCTGPWQRIADLSGGNQQKVAIARVLEQGGALVLVDEPTRGIDVRAKDAIHEILRSAADEGRTIVVVSSENRELLALCDRIAVMWRGKLGAPRAAAEWSEHSLVDAALRGENTQGTENAA